jgi:hypothetical protein
MLRSIDTITAEEAVKRSKDLIPLVDAPGHFFEVSSGRVLALQTEEPPRGFTTGLLPVADKPGLFFDTDSKKLVEVADFVERRTDVDTVNHPAHYGGGDNPYEAIKVIEAWGLSFTTGNALKYILRAGKKSSVVEDLKKALWYIRRAREMGASECNPRRAEAVGDGFYRPEEVAAAHGVSSNLEDAIVSLISGRLAIVESCLVSELQTRGA